MRTEMKIALSLFATNTLVGHLLPAPGFIRGMLLGLSIFLMVVGMLSEHAYGKYKVRQAAKFSRVKKMVGMN
jgi:hypothetical protein